MREQLLDAAEEVFDELGPGWSESIYHKALIRELGHRGIPVYTEGSLSVMYKGGSVGTRRPDLMVQMEDNRSIMVELKAGSTSGKAQLMQYLDMAEKTSDLGDIRGGALIQFNEELEFEFVELGPEPNPDDSLTFEKMKELPTGVEIWRASGNEYTVQLDVNPLTEEVFPEINTQSASKNTPEMRDFLQRACDKLGQRLFNDEDEENSTE